MNLLPANIVDVAIILFLIFSILDGWRRGLLALVADLLALVAGVFIGLKTYLILAPYLARFLDLTEQAGKILAFFVASLILGSLLSFIFGFGLRLIPPFIRKSWPDRVGGASVGLARGVIYIGIILLLISSLPVLQPVKNAVAESRYASPLIARSKVIAAQAEGFLKGQFGGLLEDTFTLLTIKPGQGRVDLGFRVTKFYTDEKAEEEMLRLLNGERVKRGLVPLKMDRALREAARAHSRDMFERGYFAHDTPAGLPGFPVQGQGKTPAQRLDERRIRYTIMGENLALAPDVALAHRGLMSSPSHRENILFPDYRKIGIGAINGGIYGIMFSQEFTD